MGEVLLLALLAALNPTLVGATTLMLLLANPRRLMLGYLLGAMMTSITLGIVIVFTLSESDVAKTTQRSVNPAVDLALGAIALVAAVVLRSGRDRPFIERRRKGRAGKEPPRWQRQLSKGSARATFVAGALLTLPGASYLAGLRRIEQLDYADAVSVLLVIAFNMIMLALLEVPLLCFLVAPEWTPGAVERAKAWVARRARTIAVRGLTLLGIALLVKGLVALLS